ncbi:MAG: TetR/AcrR family transcriptional regulator [Bacillaceae bacterium]|nr:TetR/AcrR family transcriptional regulator [Bacillaceae bacterium]
MSRSASSSRDKLIETTARLLEIQGYHATGLNQITKESGAPKGSLYYYFPEGKEQLACEAVKKTADIVAGRIRSELSRHEDPIVAIQTFILEMARYFQETDCSGGVPIAAVTLETSSTSDKIREACSQAYQLWQDVFAQKLHDSGFTEVRAQQLSLLIVSMIEGAVIISRSRQSSEPLKQLAGEIPNLLKK